MSPDSVTQSTALMPATPILPAEMDAVLVSGDLKGLSPQQRVEYYGAVCKSLGLNPLTKPFDYLSLNGKLTLYAKKDCTDQLRKIYGVSIQFIDKSIDNGVLTVTARATDRTGRQDEDCGSVTIGNAGGDMRANAIMKAHTKAKRRVTLSICGLGMMDESELETVRGAIRMPSEEVAHIDTGGHAHGTREAQDYVAMQKLAELAVHVDDVPNTPAKPKAAAAKPKTTTNFKALEAIGDIKADLKKLAGNDDEYYRILREAAGVDHANQILDVEVQRALYKLLLARRNDLMIAAQAPPKPMSEDDMLREQFEREQREGV